MHGMPSVQFSLSPASIDAMADMTLNDRGRGNPVCVVTSTSTSNKSDLDLEGQNDSDSAIMLEDNITEVWIHSRAQ